METNKRSRVKLALGSLVAVGLLLAAFVAVWLMPRGPQSGEARVNTPSGQEASVGSTGSTGSVGSAGGGPAAGVGSGAAPQDMARATGSGYAQVGVPSGPTTDQPHITVHGSGTIAAKPDMAVMQVGVQIQKDSLDGAQTEAANKMNDITAKLKQAGIDDKDIATSQYNVEPVMNYRQNEPPVVTGFRVTNMASVKVRDLSKAGKLIDDLVRSGANTLYGLSFSFSDPSALMRQAREAAMKDARAKAEQLAGQGGVTLGTPIIIEDGGSNVPPPVMPMADTSAERGVASAAPPPVNPGQQEIRADVSVVYSIK